MRRRRRRAGATDVTHVVIGHRRRCTKSVRRRHAAAEAVHRLTLERRLDPRVSDRRYVT